MPTFYLAPIVFSFSTLIVYVISDCTANCLPYQPLYIPLTNKQIMQEYSQVPSEVQRFSAADKEQFAVLHAAKIKDIQKQMARCVEKGGGAMCLYESSLL